MAQMERPLRVALVVHGYPPEFHSGTETTVQSLARGLPTEVHYRVGELVLLGRLHGVPTPASDEVLRAATSPGLAQGRDL